MPMNAASYYPAQGGGTAKECEAAGQPGAKEAMPPYEGSMASDDGYHDTPTGGEKNPSNITGDVESAGPTKAEGDLGVQEFPHKGPPERTTSVGSGTQTTNPEKMDY